MGVCEISTDTLIAAPVQGVTSGLLGSVAQKLMLLGVFIGIAILAIVLYRRSQKKEKKEEKRSFQPKEREK